MRKHVSISNSLDVVINDIKKIEETKTLDNSYSKILNYLAVLGVERYNELFKIKLKIPEFDFDKYYRQIYNNKVKRGEG